MAMTSARSLASPTPPSCCSHVPRAFMWSGRSTPVTEEQSSSPAQGFPLDGRALLLFRSTEQHVPRTCRPAWAAWPCRGAFFPSPPSTSLLLAPHTASVCQHLALFLVVTQKSHLQGEAFPFPSCVLSALFTLKAFGGFRVSRADGGPFAGRAVQVPGGCRGRELTPAVSTSREASGGLRTCYVDRK